MRTYTIFRLGTVLLASVLMTLSLRAQLVVDTAMDPNQMVQNLVGEGVQIFNVQVTAADGSFGYYYSTGTELGTNQGLLLSTGQAVNAIGPNNSSGLPQLGPGGVCLNCDQYDNDFPGSDLLDEAQDRNTFDACMIEFDIVPQGDSLSFSYTFASEEYLEWVGSPFNDVFGFFITGPNIGTDVNIALIPNTSNAVAINNVNNVSNSQYFYNNITPPGQGVQFDGFTINLVAAVGDLIPCETYHLKLIIGDGSDRLYDSGVFVNRIESNPVVVLTTTAGGIDYMIEGCNDGTISFCRTFATPDPQEVVYWLGGTALNGTDYSQQGTGTPGEQISLTIPANELCVSIPIESFADNIIEGLEYMTIYLGNPLCDGVQVLDSANFYIADALEVTASADPAEICAGQCTQLTGTSVDQGDVSYLWTPADGLADPTALITEACPTTTTTYTLTTSVAECSESASVTVSVSFITIDLDASESNCGTSGTGSIQLTVNDAVAPLTILWEGPDGYTSSDEDPTNLGPGEYCVTVTDAAGCVANGCVTIIQTNELEFTGQAISDYTCFPISCFGASDGFIDVSITGGVEPYTFVWTSNNGYTSDQEDALNIPAGTYTLTITDALGCELTDSWTLDQPEEVSLNVVGTVDLLCTGVETGSAEVAASGGCTPYFYSWSHDPNLTAPLAQNLGSGTYTVSVSDINGCSSQGSVEIIINDPIDPVNITVDEIGVYPGGFNISCPDAEDAYVNITTAGGTLPYSFEWVRVGTGIVSTDEDLVDAACGTYVLTVTDGNGCVITQNFTLTCVPAIQITTDTEPNPCGDETAGLGVIDILTTTGGQGPVYTYSWTGPDNFTSNDEDLTGLNSGTYTVTVTDALGCSDSFNVTVGTNSDFEVTAVETDILCAGTCSGSINLTVTPAGSYTFTWTGPNGPLAGTEDQSNLCPGTYTVEVEALGCISSNSFTITEPDPIIILVNSAIPPVCFGQNNGAIDISVSGGTGNLSISWAPNAGIFFPGSSNEDIANLFEGCYTVTVTDENGCSESETICIEAPQVMDISVEVTEFNGGFNISCADAQDGQISVSVSGGTFPYTYDWSNCSDVTPNDPNAPFLTGLSGGTYCVSVFDANGCLATTTIPMLEPEPITDGAIVTDVTCFGENDGTITPNLAGGTGIYTDFDWSQGDDIGANAPNASTLTNLGPGCYTLVVTDNNSCTSEFTWCITEPSELELTIAFTQDVTCFGANDGAASFSASGGTPGYSFTVNGPGGPYSGALVTNLPGGSYTVTVVDDNGCTQTQTFEINEPEPFSVTIDALVANEGQIYTLQCFGDEAATLDANVSGGVADFTYEWTDAGNNVIGTDTLVSALAAGTYCVTVTDANGCEADACFEVTQPEEALVITSEVSLYTGGYNISCFNACDGSIDLTVTGGVPGYIYQWELGNGQLDGNEDQADLCAGFYEVLVTDANGCQQLVQFELTEPAPLIVDVVLSQYGNYNISCADACDGTISVNILGGEGPYTIDWADPNLADETELVDVCAGTYAYTITDALGCTVDGSVTLTQPEPLVATITDTFICESGEMELCVEVSGGDAPYTLDWDTGSTSTCIFITVDGEYCVTVTDANGCSVVVCGTYTVPDAMEIQLNVTSTTCGLDNGAIDLVILAGDGPFTFDWSGPGVDPDSEDQTDLGPGTYSVTITDGQQCEVTGQVTIQDEPVPTLTAQATQIPCFGDGNGAITTTVVNAAEPVDYAWTGPDGFTSSDASLTDLAPGTYTLTWTDEEGCGGTQSWTITEPEAITINAEISLYEDGFNISEFGGNDGAIDTDVQGGTGQYDYDWNVDALDGEADVANLIAGEYILTVTDANGCVVDTTITLTEPSDLLLPTGLSPNGDGYNDGYVIQGVSGFPDNEFRVFNRWGNLVYEKADYNNEWEGQSKNGEMLPDGTYFIVFVAGGREFNTYVDLRR